ncbi:hypothetical protein [Mycoplasma sp. ATU-Cv-508]|uniref:hypothetical protein n=1 Tax=Mycoplasma sp. ATU-Cv-508 TaxID=2048001 RepID=UPI000FDEE9AF
MSAVKQHDKILVKVKNRAELAKINYWAGAEKIVVFSIAPESADLQSIYDKYVRNETPSHFSAVNKGAR